MRYGSRFDEALVLASELHRDHHRKGADVPYVTHLLATAAIVGEIGGDEDEVIAALLHDAVEDQGGRETLDEIRRRFGERVAAIVEGCTDAWGKPKPPWRDRKQAFLASLESASPSVLLVTCADKLHNATTTVRGLRQDGAATWDRFSTGRDDQLWLYRSLVDVLRRRGAQAALVDELERTVDAMASLAAG